MTLAHNLKLVLASSLLLTVVSCGNDSKSKPAAQKEDNTIVQNYEWKIFNGRGYPANAMVEVSVNGNTETVFNSCHMKNANVISRSANPQVLTVFNGLNPSGSEFVNVKVYDMGDCKSNVNPNPTDDTVRYELNKSGTVGEVIVNI